MTTPAEVLAGDARWCVMDCVTNLDVLRSIPDSSVDSVVTDPPYGISFMGKDWDNPHELADAGDTFDPEHVQRQLKRDTRRKNRNRNRKGSDVPSPAMAAGRYTQTCEANRAFQAWCEVWARECLRILKPGGYLVAFGSTRTSHRLAAGIEDAGFEIRDTLAWLFGSGMPKGKDVGKAIDDHLGFEREVVAVKKQTGAKFKLTQELIDNGGFNDPDREEYEVTAPASDEAKRWDGWNVALKPAFEPIVTARKPLVGNVAENFLEHGVGGLNVKACRIGYKSDADRESAFPAGAVTSLGSGSLAGPGAAQDAARTPFQAVPNDVGRWPANVVMTHEPGCREAGTRTVGKGERRVAGPGTQPLSSDRGWNEHSMRRDGASAPESYGAEVVPSFVCAPGCAVQMLDEQTGELRSGLTAAGTQRSNENMEARLVFGEMPRTAALRDYGGDVGGASRFFYCGKVSRLEREAGCELLPVKTGAEAVGRKEGSAGVKNPRAGASRTARDVRNVHPTLKPIALMRWLLRLVTPPGGVVVDPFTGSGSTGCAAVLEGIRFVGMDWTPDYCAISRARIAYWDSTDGARQGTLFA